MAWSGKSESEKNRWGRNQWEKSEEEINKWRANEREEQGNEGWVDWSRPLIHSGLIMSQSLREISGGDLWRCVPAKCVCSHFSNSTDVCGTNCLWIAFTSYLFIINFICVMGIQDFIFFILSFSITLLLLQNYILKVLQIGFLRLVLVTLPWFSPYSVWNFNMDGNIGPWLLYSMPKAAGIKHSAVHWIFCTLLGAL